MGSSRDTPTLEVTDSVGPVLRLQDPSPHLQSHNVTSPHSQVRMVAAPKQSQLTVPRIESEMKVYSIHLHPPHPHISLLATKVTAERIWFPCEDLTPNDLLVPSQLG